MAMARKQPVAAMGVLLVCSLALVISVAARGRGIDHAPDIPAPDETIFNVLKYGAKPNGKAECTQAFMDTWIAACHFKGKARVLVPEGVFKVGPVVFSGPCSGPAPIIYQVLGTVQATTDVSEYTDPEWIQFVSITGLRVIGGGTFDGQGASVWEYNDCRGNSACQLPPFNIKFNKITDGVIRGLRSLNSKSFHLFITNCNNFRAQRLHITAPADSPNTDGIHVSDSNLVKITNVVIATGDDCISIGKGSTAVTIRKITCGPGHGISVGSLGKYPDEKDVRGIVVRNCTLKETGNGVRIKTWPGSPPSVASGMIFEDIIMDRVNNPIIIDQQYCSSSKSCDTKQGSRVKISDIHYRNIRGTSTSPVAVNILCSKDFPCQNVQLFNVNLKYAVSTGLNLLNTISVCQNAKVGFTGITIPPRC